MMNLDEELFKAVENGDIARVKKFLKHAKLENGKSPLHFAVERFFSQESECINIVKTLLEVGADVNAKDDFGRTPLHYAAWYGLYQIVKILIEKGAHVNIRDNDLNTPLHVAAFGMRDFNRSSIARLLLEEGADPNAKNSNGETPLHLVAEFPVYEYRREASNFAQELLNHGADVNARNRCGWTPLHYAASSHNSIVADLLIRNGAHVNARESMDGWTPLHVALLPVHPPCGAPYAVLGIDIEFEIEAIGFIVILIRHGADLNVRDKNGNTPLHVARGVYTPWLLLKFGADPSARNNEGRTPLGVAREPGAQEIVNMLEEFAKKPRRSESNVNSFLEESKKAPTSSSEQGSLCPYCGRHAYRLVTLGRYYCFNCKRYV